MACSLVVYVGLREIDVCVGGEGDSRRLKKKASKDSNETQPRMSSSLSPSEGYMLVT